MPAKSTTKTPDEEFGRRVRLPHNLTNDEYGRLLEIVEFLVFMRQESAPVPETNDELSALLRNWLKQDRRERRKEAARMARKQRADFKLRVKKFLEDCEGDTHASTGEQG